MFLCVLQIFSHVAQKLPFLVCCVAHTVAVLGCVVLLPHLQGPSCYTWCFDQESWFSLLSGIATNQQASGIAKNYLELRHGLVQVASTNNATCCVALRGSGGWIPRHLGLRTPRQCLYGTAIMTDPAETAVEDRLELSNVFWKESDCAQEVTLSLSHQQMLLRYAPRNMSATPLFHTYTSLMLWLTRKSNCPSRRIEEWIFFD